MAPQNPFSYGGLELRLHTREAGPARSSVASGEDPFVTVAPPTHGVRFYSASLMLGEKPIVPWLALALESNEYPGTPGVAPPPGASFAHIGKVWREAMRAAAELSANSVEGIVRLERRALPEGLVEGDVPRTPPLVYCTKIRATFEPLCPSCLGHLTVCRDESVLRACGLPSFATSLTRYLYCEICAQRKGHPRIFYTESRREWEAAVEGARVKRRSELYRDLAPRIQGGPAEAANAPGHACFVCEHRTACYPLGRDVVDSLPAEALLFPLAYYGALYIPFEAVPFAFDEAAALLGGASVESAVPRDRTAVGADVATLAERATAPLGAAAPQFFYEGDPTGLFGLEAFFLKMGAFAGLARGVLALYETSRRPHLAITPDRVRGSRGVASSLVPARWSIGFVIADLVTTAPFDELANADSAVTAGLAKAAAGAADEALGRSAPTVWSLPFPLPEAFLPEALSRSPIDHLVMRLVPSELRVVPRDGAAVVRLEGKLVSEDYVESEHGRHDLVHVAVQAHGGERVLFRGAKSGAAAGGFHFEGESALMDATVAAAMATAMKTTASSAEVVVHHAYGSPADVWSLGLLLLRLLIVNDRQEVARVNRDAVRKIVRAATTAAGAKRAATGATTAGGRETIQAIFAKAGLDASPSAVLYREGARTARPPAIPQVLWRDALLLALRMASNVPGFSICEAIDDYPAEDPALPVRRVVEEVELLVERVRGELIGSSGRNAAVMEVCADFLDDVKAAARGPAEEPASESEIERTMIGSKRRKR